MCFATTTLESYSLKGAARYRLLGLLAVAVRLALNPGLLAALRGAPLSVLLALALHANQERTCFPAIATLCKDTGYGRTTVIKALDTLEALALVGRTRRANTSTLYRLAAPDAPGASGSENDPPAKEVQKTDANEVVVVSSSKAKHKQQHVRVQKLDFPHKEVQKADVAQRAVQKMNTPEDKPPDATQLSFDEDWLPVVEALKEAGVSATRAEALTRQVQQRGHPPLFVEQRVAHYRHQRQAGRANGVGFLVASILHEWELPAPRRTRIANASDEWRQFIEREFADYIEH